MCVRAHMYHFANNCRRFIEALEPICRPRLGNSALVISGEFYKFKKEKSPNCELHDIVPPTVSQITSLFTYYPSQNLGILFDPPLPFCPH